MTMEIGLHKDAWVRFDPNFLGSAVAGIGRQDGRTLEFRQEGQIFEQAAELLKALDISFEVDVDE